MLKAALVKRVEAVPLAVVADGVVYVCKVEPLEPRLFENGEVRPFCQEFIGLLKERAGERVTRRARELADELPVTVARLEHQRRAARPARLEVDDDGVGCRRRVPFHEGLR